MDRIVDTMRKKEGNKNRIQWSNLGDWADISVNNCICELWWINQIEGKIIALKYSWNISSGNYLESCEVCKSKLEMLSGQERES